jgi:hypothetical protein
MHHMVLVLQLMLLSGHYLSPVLGSQPLSAPSAEGWSCAGHVAAALPGTVRTALLLAAAVSPAGMAEVAAAAPGTWQAARKRCRPHPGPANDSSSRTAGVQAYTECGATAALSCKLATAAQTTTSTMHTTPTTCTAWLKTTQVHWSHTHATAP